MAHKFQKKRLQWHYEGEQEIDKYCIPAIYSTPSNYSIALLFTPRNIGIYLNLYFSHLKQPYLVNKTLNMN